MTGFSIWVLGNVGLDMSMGPLEALPQWGTEVVAGGPTTYRPGGGAGNMAVALAGLRRLEVGLTLSELEGQAPAGAASASALDPNVHVQVLCAVGEDGPGQTLRAQFERIGLPVGLQTISGQATSLGLALVRADGERAFVTDLGALARMDLAWARRSLRGARGPGFFVVNGASLLPALGPAGVGELFREMRQRGFATCLDTGWDVNGWPPEVVRLWEESLRVTDYFFPNELEALALTGEADPQRAGAVLQTLSRGVVVVKMGPMGAVIADGAEPRHVPTTPQAIPDTTGAGDVFDSCLLYALGHGLSVDEAARLAQRGATRVLLSRRTYFPSFRELLEPAQ